MSTYFSYRHLSTQTVQSQKPSTNSHQETLVAHNRRPSNISYLNQPCRIIANNSPKNCLFSRPNAINWDWLQICFFFCTEMLATITKLIKSLNWTKNLQFREFFPSQASKLKNKLTAFSAKLFFGQINSD